MVICDIRNGIGHLVIDMPGRSMNVLEPIVAAAIGDAFEALLADHAVKGIVISSGKSSFIAGADLAQMKALAAPGVALPQAAEMISYLGKLFRRIETCGKPVVAAASGTALGGGLELMLSCHYRIAADNPKAQFGLPEVTLGLLPGAGGTQRVPRLIGIAKSLPMLLSGTPMKTQGALKFGILDEVVRAEDLLAAAEAAITLGRAKAIAPWDEKGWKTPGGDAYAPANASALMLATSTQHAATHGNYPAPIAILRCVYEGAKLPIDKALKLEQKHFAILVQGVVSQNLIRTQFFAKQAADKLTRRPAGIPKSSVKKIGVLGAGFMGAGIADVSARVGIDVVLVDRELALADKARDGIAKSLDADVQKGRLTPAAKDAMVERIRAADSHAAFADCDLVIEAVVEDRGIKAIVTKLSEAQMRSDAIFASNTSALPISELAKFSTRPKNFIGLHFFSPVRRMELVEVIVGQDTSDETLARSLDYIQQIKKTPIVVNDGYGFYTTRCVFAYLREGIRMLADGVAPALIENAAVGVGMPVGPLSLSDEVGIDVLQHIGHSYLEIERGAAADDRHKAVMAVIDGLCAQKHYGRKSGGGFYRYPTGEAKQLAVTLPVTEAQTPAAEIGERLLYAQVIEAARCWADGITTDAAEADLGATLGWAFPTYLGGPFAFIDTLGAGAFVKRSDELTAMHGPRFDVPARLREAAAAGFRFHSHSGR